MSKVRARILEVASELFYQQGIKAVGVDAIISKADVARMSFYRHFTSKEGLVLAFIRGRDEEFRGWLAAQVERLARDLNDRPLAVFDALAVRLATPGYRGCAFINTMVESADRNDLAYQAAAEHKARFEGYLAGLLSDAGLDPRHAADLLLLFDGAVVAAVREGSVEPAKRARRLAALLLADARLPQFNERPSPTEVA
jgi:AcrR family transcriptional regulator